MAVRADTAAAQNGLTPQLIYRSPLREANSVPLDSFRPANRQQEHQQKPLRIGISLWSPALEKRRPVAKHWMI